MAEKQTILLTGGCGFIGTNMVRLLISGGMYRVVNLDALTYAANPSSLEDLDGHPDYVFVRGDIIFKV
jgi:dTDP-glucose 4,6-dehydratase